MANWDDIRFFLAVVRHGSVRSASAALRVNHSTVLRRIAQLEGHLGARLFEKLPSGYELTDAGQEILDQAAQMEQLSAELEAQVFGRDTGLSGKLRVALPTVLLTDLLMPHFATFSDQHPEIDLELATSYEPVNLTKRQADVAIRLVYDQKTLPEHLHGLKLSELHGGVYISRDFLKARTVGSRAVPVRWIQKEEEIEPPSWTGGHDLQTHPSPVIVTDMQAQIAATRAGLGISALPCFLGDADPALLRVPGSQTHLYGMLWMLSYGETRKTRRVRLFADFIKAVITQHSELLAGAAYKVASA